MDTEVECMNIATTLRDNGIKVMVEMNKRKLKKSFEFAYILKTQRTREPSELLPQKG